MTVTDARGSALSRCATSSRHALSTLVRRDRLRGNPPARQETASAGLCASMRRTEQSDEVVFPRPSETRTVTDAVDGAVTPVKSRVALEVVPVTRPAVVLHA